MNEPLILAGDIPLRITADWIIQLAPEQSAEKENIVIVTLCNDKNSGTPAAIKGFLKGLGIRTVDYPSTPETI